MIYIPSLLYKYKIQSKRRYFSVDKWAYEEMTLRTRRKHTKLSVHLTTSDSRITFNGHVTCHGWTSQKFYPFYYTTQKFNKLSQKVCDFLIYERYSFTTFFLTLLYGDFQEQSEFPPKMPATYFPVFWFCKDFAWFAGMRMTPSVRWAAY